MPTDLSKLQGTWTVISLEIDAHDVPDSEFSDSHITIKKDKFKSIAMGADYQGTIAIDETKQPKTFDLLFTAGPEKGNRSPGIYKLDDDTWTICIATRGNKRPRKFATAAGSGIALETLQRGLQPKAGPKAKPAGPEHVAAPPTGVAEFSEIEGEWMMLSAVFNGAPLDEKMVQWCKRVTAANVTTVTAGPQVMLKATFSLDRSFSPKRIDYINLTGAAKGKAQAGIYELEGAELRICMAAPGNKRPGQFESKRGDGRSLTAWRLAAHGSREGGNR